MTVPAALERRITLLPATALVVGIIVGSSIFVQPSVITGTVPTLGAVYAVWIVAGVLTLFGALIAAELASAFPRAGGVYVFLRESWSPGLAFLWGWAMFWTTHTGIIAAIAMIFARYVAYFVPVGSVGLQLLAISAVIVLSVVNYRGVRQGALVQTTLTIVKVGAVMAIIAIAFALGPRGGVSVDVTLAAATPADAATAGPLTTQTFALALVAGLFAFGGWHIVTYAAEETVNAERTIRRALVGGVAIVTACYVGLNAAYFHVLTPPAVAGSSRVAADAADAVLGRGGAAFMAAVVALSTLGALNGLILAGPRVYLAMARDGLLWRWVGEIHPRFGSPHRAIALQAAWAIVLVTTGSYRVLFTRAIYTEWIFFALMAAGLMRLRKREDYAPLGRIPWHPVLPVVFIVSSVYIVFNQIRSDPAESLTGLFLVGIGWPVYRFWLSERLTPSSANGG